MIRLTVISGRATAKTVIARHWPFKIGRSPDSGLCLEDPGVWGTHAILTLNPTEGFVVESHPGAGLGVNGIDVPHQRLRNGDVLTLGGARVRFALAEVAQRSFAVREWATWLAVVLLTALQVALVHWVLP